MKVYASYVMKLEICFWLWVGGSQSGRPHILLEMMKQACCIEKLIFSSLLNQFCLNIRKKQSSSLYNEYLIGSSILLTPKWKWTSEKENV